MKYRFIEVDLSQSGKWILSKAIMEELKDGEEIISMQYVPDRGDMIFLIKTDNFTPK